MILFHTIYAFCTLSSSFRDIFYIIYTSELDSDKVKIITKSDGVIASEYLLANNKPISIQFD